MFRLPVLLLEVEFFSRLRSIFRRVHREHDNWFFPQQKLENNLGTQRRQNDGDKWISKQHQDAQTLLLAGAVRAKNQPKTWRWDLSFKKRRHGNVNADRIFVYVPKHDASSLLRHVHRTRQLSRSLNSCDVYNVLRSNVRAHDLGTNGHFRLHPIASQYETSVKVPLSKRCPEGPSSTTESCRGCCCSERWF